MNRAKTLLLTGSVPGTAHVGEIILRDVVNYYGPQNMHCLAVLPEAALRASQPDPAELPLRLLRSSYVNAGPQGSRIWGALARRMRFLAGFRREVARLEAIVVAESRAAGVQQVFAVLNNPLVMALSHRVARTLALPLVSLVWDPAEYQFRQFGFDRWSRRALHAEFRVSLAASSRVAVVSETMQADYARWTKAPIDLFRQGVAAAPAARGSLADPPSDEWVIGFAGSMYSSCAWRALLRALDQADWRIAGRPLRLKLLTGRIELASRRPARIDYLGFRSPEEAQAILEACHLTYMPQPFVPHLAELCRYSFPTKLSAYLALGRPVLVHSPRDSALAGFVARHPVGAHADSLEPAAILAALEGLLGDAGRYAEASRQAGEVARVHFATTVFHAAIERALGSETPPANAAAA